MLSDYNFVLSPRAGSLQVVSNALSRLEWLARQPGDIHQVLPDETRFVNAIALPRPLFVSSLQPIVNSDSETCSSSGSDYKIADYESNVSSDHSDSSDTATEGDDNLDKGEDDEVDSDALLPVSSWQSPPFGLFAHHRKAHQEPLAVFQSLQWRVTSEGHPPQPSLRGSACPTLWSDPSSSLPCDPRTLGNLYSLAPHSSPLLVAGHGRRCPLVY
jgi:hypothetical protein